MPLRPRYAPRQQQAPIGLGLSSRLPTPFCVLRPLGAAWRVDTYRGAVLTSQTTYGTVTKTLGRAGEGVVYSSGGSLFTFDATGANWSRTSWCFACSFISTSTASIQTIASINGDLNGLQLRINTSAQVEILSEGAALLDTSTLTITVGAVYNLSVCSNAAMGTTEVWINGVRWINYAGTIDIKDPATAMRFYIGRRLTAADNFIIGAVFDASFWAHGAGQLPTPQQQQAFTSHPGLRAALFPQRRRIQLLTAAAAATGHPAMRRLGGIRFARGIDRPGAPRVY